MPELYFSEPNDPAAADSPFALGLHEIPDTDPIQVGPIATTLAVVERSGAVTLSTMVLTADGVAQLADPTIDLRDARYGRVDEHEPDAVQGLREIWNIVGQGGLSPVTLRVPGRTFGVGATGEPIMVWAEFVAAVLTHCRSSLEPLVIQRHLSGAFVIRVRPAAGRDDASLEIDLSGYGIDEVSFLDRRGKVHGPRVRGQHAGLGSILGRRVLGQQLYSALVGVFDQFVEPVDLVVLIDESGFRSVRAVAERA